MLNLIINIAGELTQLVNLLSLATLAFIALGVQVFFRSHLAPEVAHEDALFAHQMTIRERRLRNMVNTVEERRATQQVEIDQVLGEVRRLNVVRSQLEQGQKHLRAQLDLAMRKGGGQQHVIQQLLNKSQQMDHMQESLRKRDALIHFMLKQKKIEREAAHKQAALEKVQAHARTQAAEQARRQAQAEAEGKAAQANLRAQQLRAHKIAQGLIQSNALQTRQAKKNTQIAAKTNVSLFPVDFLANNQRQAHSELSKTPSTSAGTKQAIEPKLLSSAGKPHQSRGIGIIESAQTASNADNATLSKFKQWSKLSTKLFRSNEQAQAPDLIPVTAKTKANVANHLNARAPHPSQPVTQQANHTYMATETKKTAQA